MEKTNAKHRLSDGEKKVKEVVMSWFRDGYTNQTLRDCMRLNIKVDGNTVTQCGKPIFKIKRRYSARKTNGCYKELLPTLEYIA